MKNKNSRNSGRLPIPRDIKALYTDKWASLNQVIRSLGYAPPYIYQTSIEKAKETEALEEAIFDVFHPGDWDWLKGKSAKARKLKNTIIYLRISGRYIQRHGKGVEPKVISVYDQLKRGLEQSKIVYIDHPSDSSLSIYI
ncbi:MAG TPA: hypothetical protein VK076_06980 [Candidatus Sphingobacterium stercoripullorum]|nr:hypothetical protein [Candidatus Sphingobacterium stercoripullorum]